MQYEHVRELRALDVEIESYFDGQLFKNKIWVGTIEVVRLSSFSFVLARSLTLVIAMTGKRAFVAPLYWGLYGPKGLNSARICFTCHNFEYQGTAPASELTSCGLDVDNLNRPDRTQDNSVPDRISAAKGGIVFSNIVTTVLPTYAKEVRTAEGG